MRAKSLLVALVALLLLPVAARASDVIVQGTTDVRDAGLLDDKIIPEFQAAYPQYTVKYIAVGTGQALTNAKAGQGDAVLTHAPTQEADFVKQGYSYEPLGRAIFYSDYVILGPANDPAGVKAGAPNDAAHAYELIAAAGDAGTANFVSRGDNSGTNTQEKIIWGLSNVAKNAKNEPGSGASSNPSWYHKANLGQADTVQVANQCNFPGGGCYEMTDRGTYNRLKAEGAVPNLQIVSEKNSAAARGGVNLQINSFHAYIVNPAKVSATINVAGAKAFLDFLTSEQFQGELKSYPNTTDPAFYADARPNFGVKTPATLPLPTTIDADQKLDIRGLLTNPLPGGYKLIGAPVNLQRVDSATSAPVLVPTTTSNGQGYKIQHVLYRSGTFRLFFPGLLDLQPATLALGKVNVRAVIDLKKARVDSNGVLLKGSIHPDRDRVKPVVIVEGRKAGSKSFRKLGEDAQKTRSSTFASTVKLKSGKWQVRVVYQDPGIVTAGTSKTLKVTVP